MESKVNFFLFLFALFLISFFNSIFSINKNIKTIVNPIDKNSTSTKFNKLEKIKNKSNKEKKMNSLVNPELIKQKKIKKYSAVYHKSSGQISNTALWLDLLIPSYGMYSLNHKIEGITYGTLKVATAVGMYFIYQHYNTWNNYYLQNKNLNQPEETIFTTDGQFLTLQAIQNKADISFLTFTYIVLFEVVIYSVSFYRTYSILNSKKNKFNPYYSIFPKVSFLYNKNNNTSIQLKWNYLI